METKDLKWLLAYALAIAALLFVQSRRPKTDPFLPGDWDDITRRGEITILTVKGFNTWFVYKTEQRGYEYKLAEAFAKEHGLKLNVCPAPSTDSLAAMIKRGRGEIIAFNIPTDSLPTSLLPCGRITTDGDDTANIRSWATRRTLPVLAATLDRWFENHDFPVPSTRDRHLFEYSQLPGDEPAPVIGNGCISVYDSLFRHYAASIGWDWRLLASMAFQESKFHTDLTSREGAGGLMGIMPRTAEIFGLPADSIFDPEANLRTAARLIERLNSSFSNIENHDERQKFIIAAYNCGSGHIADARALAEKYGKNPNLWADTEEFLRLKNLPEYYDDPACHSGAFNAAQTIFYLRGVTERAEYYSEVAE
jgi:membrane-bound lytic murein transglycosylase F